MPSAERWTCPSCLRHLLPSSPCFDVGGKLICRMCMESKTWVPGQIPSQDPHRKASLADIAPGASIPAESLAAMSYLADMEDREVAKDARIRELKQLVSFEEEMPA